MSTTPPVIIYRYDSSPYSHKIDNVLFLKGINHSRVNVSIALPRPEITDLLGVTYRRIPILAIGNDIYCDTNLITSALERRFPAAEGYGTLFPHSKHGGSADTGLIKAFSKYYTDELFNLGPLLLPWDKFPADFLKDRGSFRGAPVDVKANLAARQPTLSKLSSHFALIEEQLKDGREWLFDTELPGLADISIHFILAWVGQFRGVESLYDAKQFPATLKWLSRLSAFVERKKKKLPTPTTLGGNDAVERINNSTFEPLSVVGFNVMEANRLSLKQDHEVKITPEDTGRIPTIGKLAALNREEMVIQVQGRKGVAHVHFPRIGFSVQAAVTESKL